MKKNSIYKILLAAATLSFGSLKSQTATIELQKNDHLTNSEANLHKGIPSINIPITNVSVAPDNINVGVSLSYSTEGVSAFKMISDVGKGWSLQYGGSIVKSHVMTEKDYIIDSNYPTETSSVIYYYNFLGNSGRFYIGKDQTTEQLIAVQLQPSKNKILVNRDISNPNKIASFSITDTGGNTYLFDKIDIDHMRFLNTGSTSTSTQDKVYNSAFLLSTIKNNKNQQVASFEYETTTELISQFVGTVQENKIKNININNYGNIAFIYKPNSQPHSLKNKGDKDWYQIDKLILKDKNGSTVSQYTFSGSGFLEEFTTLDRNNNVIEKYFFDYNKSYGGPPELTSGLDAYGYVNMYNFCSLDEGALMLPDTTNPKTAVSNTLKSITLPTGGKVEYEFESNSVKSNSGSDHCVNNNCYEYYNLDKVYTWSFDSTQSSVSDPFNFPAGYKGNVYVKYTYSSYPGLPPKPGVTYFIDTDLLDLSGNVIPYVPYSNVSNSQDCSSIRVYNVPLQSIKKALVKGNLKGYGTLEFYSVKEARKHNNRFGYGLRIKSIKNYDAGSQVPSKWLKYEYNLFSDSLTSSGQVPEQDELGDLSILSGGSNSDLIEYANVKTTNMLDNTSTKYIFYTSSEIQGMLSGLNNSAIDFGGFMKRKGLLKQKEVYGNSNILLQETAFSYQPQSLLIDNVKYKGNTISKILIKKEITTVKDYVNGNNQTLTNTIENEYENQYNNLVYTKETLYDGSVVEKSLKYAKEKNIQKLVSANIVGTLLETEIKNDGKIVSKTETKLDDPSTLYPTSVLAYNIPNQNSSQKINFNNYDDKGNLRELKSENGIPAVSIWGYHQTQLIAKIGGATYAEVSNLSSVTAAVSASDADDNDSSKEPALIQALDYLRKDDALKNYQIETYTYDPLIGITSKTGANGLKETYQYDSSHRVSKILDQDGRIIKTYDYHYSSPLYANEETGQEYESNNCGAGFLPNRYMYVVPANKYFSYISKDDANQKAYQDVLANGQNTANQVAGCTSLACTITKGYDISTLNSASLTMPDPSNFRLQMSFPFDSSMTWTTEKSIGKMEANCFTTTGNSIARPLSYGQWKIVIYSNGNIRAKLPSSVSIPNGTIINIDVTFPIEYIPVIEVP